MPLQRAHEVWASLCLVRHPVGERLVVGFYDFVPSFGRDREKRDDRSCEVAQFLVLPVEEALEKLHAQRFAGGEDGAQRGPHVLAELLQIGELPLEVLEEYPSET